MSENKNQMEQGFNDTHYQQFSEITANQHSNAKVIEVPFENNNEISVLPEMAVSINEAKQRLAMLQSFVKEMMIPDVDYGIIQGCKKPSLYKSGAEKLTDIYGLSKHFEITNRVEDWERKIFHYEIKAVLINKKTGLIEAEGVGCCNNKEKKYIYQDGFNILNTILKMAKKRAFVDAVLSATRSSAIFTQDIEDMAVKDNSTNTPPSYVLKPATTTECNINEAKESTITKAQLHTITAVLNERNIKPESAKSSMQKLFNITDIKQLTIPQANRLIEFFKGSNPTP